MPTTIKNNIKEQIKITDKLECNMWNRTINTQSVAKFPTINWQQYRLAHAADNDDAGSMEAGSYEEAENNQLAVVWKRRKLFHWFLLITRVIG